MKLLPQLLAWLRGAWPWVPSSERSPGRESPRSEQGRWELPLGLLLPATRTLRRALKIDEATFRTHSFRPAPRDFVLWTALDEVEKVAMVLMRLDGFLDDKSATHDVTDSIHRTALTMIAEEARLRARRVSEVLCQLVLFAGKDEEAYYRHFLLLDELVEANWFNEDCCEFHGAASAWVQATIDQIVREISVAEAAVDFNHAWYADYTPPLKPSAWRGVLSRERTRVRRAIGRMTDFERMAVGSTYAEAFSQPSASIHYSAGLDPSSKITVERLTAEGTRLSFAAFCIVLRCHELLGRPQGVAIERLARAVTTNTEAPRVFAKLNVRPEIAVGDFVVARGHLGEVTAEVTSRYGYRSLQVDLLAERPLPQLSGDWFRARDIDLLFRRDRLLSGIARCVGDAVKPSASDLRQSALAAWEAGLREAVKAGSRPAVD